MSNNANVKILVPISLQMWRIFRNWIAESKYMLILTFNRYCWSTFKKGCMTDTPPTEYEGLSSFSWHPFQLFLIFASVRDKEYAFLWLNNFWAIYKIFLKGIFYGIFLVPRSYSYEKTKQNRNGNELKLPQVRA